VYAIWKWHFEMKRGTVAVGSAPASERDGHVA
jgi:hypothetical protein